MSLLSRAWTALRGADKWIEAHARGEVASDADATARVRDHCAGCVTLTLERVPLFGGSAWCGPSLEDAGDHCGCLMAVVPSDAMDRCIKEAAGDRDRLKALMRAALVPAGKSTCSREACTQWKWGPVPDAPK